MSILNTKATSTKYLEKALEDIPADILKQLILAEIKENGLSFAEAIPLQNVIHRWENVSISDQLPMH